MFTHQGRYEPILKVQFRHRTRRFRAAAGRPGSGKTTFLPAGWLAASFRRAPPAFAADWTAISRRDHLHRIAVAPQYHENHIFTAPQLQSAAGTTLPTSAQDLEEAKELCHELGFGPLLERMPGLDQIVGETGWQLSQGERDEFFDAGVVQNTEVVILDQASVRLILKPTTMPGLVTRRTKTLLVVARPES